MGSRTPQLSRVGVQPWGGSDTGHMGSLSAYNTVHASMLADLAAARLVAFLLPQGDHLNLWRRGLMAYDLPMARRTLGPQVHLRPRSGEL